MTRATFARMLVLVGTVGMAWGVLSLGTTAGDPTLEPAAPAPRNFEARRPATVVDQERTDAEIQRVVSAVAPVLREDSERESAIFRQVSDLLERVEEIAAPEPAAAPVIPEAVTTTTAQAAPDASEPPVEEVEPVTLTGFVFADVDGDAAFDTLASEGFRADLPLMDVRLVAVAASGQHFVGRTGGDGRVAIEAPPGEYTVYLDISSSGYPTGFRAAEEGAEQDVVCRSGECPLPTSVALVPQVAPRAERIAELAAEAPFLDAPTLETLTDFAEQDLFRGLASTPTAIAAIEAAVVDRLSLYFTTGVDEDEVDAIAGQALQEQRFVSIDGLASEAARLAVNELTAELVDNNLVVDQERTAEAQRLAAESVQDVVETYRQGEVIVSEGQVMSELDIAAINETGSFVEKTQRRFGMLGMLAVLVAVIAYYLARFRQRFWERPRMVALLGMLIIGASIAVRATVAAAETTGTLYVVPAVAFGYLASVLFDNRMGTLMALAMGVLTAVGTFDPGATVYAGLATLAPIGFVSAISSRKAFRNSVAISAIASAVIAAAAAWFFEVNPGANAFDEVWPHAAWAGGISLAAALVSLAVMPFFESMFDITTTLRLLELTDRNHEALQLLQDKAFGTFNHSLMVGTLADSAARAIGANTLLARAAAYFHDIGKTENPTYFIENQFGIPNPHEGLAPEKSAEVIRQHVIDGIELARRYRIPSDVAEGIVAHHGDGIMRYFYEEARQKYGPENVDPDLYRHAGHKPKTREMAIVMMADSVEGACRAVFGEEEPSRESIQKVVNRVIDEKVGDGQLSACNLTFGQLTKVREAFTDSLLGHYHQRIPYPNFPGE